MSSEEVMKGVRPGFVMFFTARKGLVFDDSGPGQAVLTFFRTSEKETVHVNILAKTKTFEEIKGRERDWLNDVLPSYFPEVSTHKKPCNAVFLILSCLAAMG